MGDQTAEVKTSIAVNSTLEGLLDDLIVTKLTLLDSLVDADNILPDDTSSANVEVANFGVAHEALGQTDGEGRSIELGETVHVLGQGVHDGSLGSGNGIAILGTLLGGNTPPVNDDCRSATADILAIRAPDILRRSKL
jgi:hypothetical protein